MSDARFFQVCCKLLKAYNKSIKLFFKTMFIIPDLIMVHLLQLATIAVLRLYLFDQ